MRILVLSDSHGNVENMIRCVDLAEPGAILHLGDCRAPFCIWGTAGTTPKRCTGIIRVSPCSACRETVTGAPWMRRRC